MTVAIELDVPIDVVDEVAQTLVVVPGVDHREGSMALFDDIPVLEEILGGGNWMTGLAIGVGALVVLPLAAPILRPLAKTAIKGGILAYRGTAGWVEGIGDIVAEAVAEGGGKAAAQAVEAAAEAT